MCIFASGFVVPIPTFPSLLTNKSELVAVVMLNAGVFPVALETLTESLAEGLVEAMPTLPFESILIASVKAPDLNVEKAKSPFPVVQFCWRIEVMALVVVPAPLMSAALNESLEAVEVGEAKLVR